MNSENKEKKLITVGGIRDSFQPERVSINAAANERTRYADLNLLQTLDSLKVRVTAAKRGMQKLNGQEANTIRRLNGLQQSQFMKPQEQEEIFSAAAEEMSKRILGIARGQYRQVKAGRES